MYMIKKGKKETYQYTRCLYLYTSNRVTYMVGTSVFTGTRLILIAIIQASTRLTYTVNHFG